jgi:hypothetical protein
MADCNDSSRDVDKRVGDVFRMFVGQGRRISYAALVEATGVPLTSLKGYAGGVAMPLHVALRLIPALPREAANMLVEPCGHKLVPFDAADKDWLSLAEKSASFAAKVIRYQATNGHIDHAEDADLLRDARELAAEATVA